MVNLAIVGATGQVGRAMIGILEERNFKVNKLRLFASARSKGIELPFTNGGTTTGLPVENIEEQSVQSLKGIDIAIFSAGGAASLKYAPLFEEAGAFVIDNSSAWRKDEDCSLIVSEVNPDDLEKVYNGKLRKIIANPNCTTMAAMPVIKPLSDKYGLKRMRVSTYQAVSGMGISGGAELAGQASQIVQSGNIKSLITSAEVAKDLDTNVFVEPVAFNVFPFAGNRVDDGMLETDEEKKLRHESKKILHLPDLKVSGTCVRVPVFTGHSLSISAEFSKKVTPEDAYDLLKSAPGVQIEDIPTPQKAVGNNPSLVGRIRNDFALDEPEFGLVLFISSDNLRKGAALNTVQIAEIIANHLAQNAPISEGSEVYGS